MDVRKLIEEINAITEDELIDDFEPSEVESFTDIPVDNQQTGSVADTLDAKTKIAKALEDVKEAIAYFKDITSQELDFVKDAAINFAIETLDTDITTIENALQGNNQEPQEQVDNMELEDVDADQEPENDESNEDEEELNFDDEAELDLFGDNNQE